MIVVGYDKGIDNEIGNSFMNIAYDFSVASAESVINSSWYYSTVFHKGDQELYIIKRKIWNLYLKVIQNLSQRL